MCSTQHEAAHARHHRPRRRSLLLSPRCGSKSSQVMESSHVAHEQAQERVRLLLPEAVAEDVGPRVVRDEVAELALWPQQWYDGMVSGGNGGIYAICTWWCGSRARRHAGAARCAHLGDGLEVVHATKAHLRRKGRLGVAGGGRHGGTRLAAAAGGRACGGGTEVGRVQVDAWRACGVVDTVEVCA
jgi:hypothetical protein